MTSITRREAVAKLGFGAAALFGAAKVGLPGRLHARPRAPTGRASVGLSPLGMSEGRDAYLYVPEAYRAATAAPLALVLHGAGQDEHVMLDPMRALADKSGLVLLAPTSRGGTWDAVRGEFGPDVARIDDALGKVFSLVNIDPARVRIAGFSDGASYALSLGLINGALFSRIAAFSPGFIVDGKPEGKPKILVTHGTNDRILPIDQTSRRLVPALKRRGYDVEYHEFAGGHRMNPDLLPQSMAWLAAR